MGIPSLFDSILRPGGLSVAADGIFEVQPETHFPQFHSLECLSYGPPGTNLERPEVLRAYVQRKHKESEVDRACTELALSSVSQLDWSPVCLINVHAATLGKDLNFQDFLRTQIERWSLTPSRLIVKIIEPGCQWNGACFLDALEGFRRMGIRIALDDIGSGQSNFRMMLDYQPDFFRIDGHFVKGVCWDTYRQAILESMSYLAQKTGVQLIAQGVDEAADLHTLLNSGITLVQGSLFSKPLPFAQLVQEHHHPFSLANFESVSTLSFEDQRDGV
ncbi:MAG TPA: EAL domain-containing protein [Acidobacteriota bacterium]|nr:EAL domain-containing protein [Acidobacteriota bacterium]HNG96225.1 EAL domain-containing protein [Acidobacteriota bacterium]